MSSTEATPSAIPAVIYAAKSTADPHASIATQLADGRAAAEREGRPILAEYQDEAASAFKGNRGSGLSAAKDTAVAAARKHGAAELWVQHSDRLARGDGITADHLAEVWFSLRRHGVRLRSVQDDGNLEDAIRVVLIGERNHEDSARKSAATSSGKRRRFERGESTGPLHEGYRLEPKLGASGLPLTEQDGRIVYRRVLDPERAPLVLRMFDMVEAGHSPGDVQRELNAEGLTTRRGKRWTTRRIRETIQDPYYAGWVVGYGERREGVHEPLLDRERWERIQAGLRRMDPVAAQRRKGGRAGAADYVLRGLGFCRECGEALYVRTHAKGNRYYQCRNVRECTGLCHARLLPAELVERHVLWHLDKFIADVDGWLAGRLDVRRQEREGFQRGVATVCDRLADLEREAELGAAAYRRLLLAGEDRRADLALDQLDQVKRETEEQRARLTEAEARLAEWTAEPDMDAALDFYNDLVAHVQGKLRAADTAAELNAALHEVLAGAWLSLDHGDTFHATFRLRPDADTVRSGGVLPEFGYDLPRPPGADGPDLPEVQGLVANRTADLGAASGLPPVEIPPLETRLQRTA